MIRDLARLTQGPLDLLVVGAGINGAAIAHLAAGAGARSALLEKGDFAGGTSSKSTKLLHGGIRYLENLEFDLVQESLKERHIQWQAAPHLVKPLSFIIPVYRHDPRPLWMMKAGVWLYDFLSGRCRIGAHRALSVDEILALAPGIQADGLVGGVEYFDAQMDDARICLENALMADAKGAAVANYVEVVDFIKDGRGKAVGVKAKDLLGGNLLEIRAKTLIVTAGPWADALIRLDQPQAVGRLRLTKGVHIVYEDQIAPSAFLLQSRSDRRIFFVIPFKGHSLIGTTDTDDQQGPEKVRADEADIRYLLQEASRVFPHIRFDPSKIITTFAGLRPLVADQGHPSRVSRKHSIECSSSGIWFVMGGKYTTYRAIAEEAIQKAMPHLSSQMPHPSEFTLYGSGAGNEALKLLSQRFDLPMELVKHVQGIYGSRFSDVLALAKGQASLKAKICTCSDTIAAQIVYARDVEMAQTPEDVIERRLGLSYLPCLSGDCRKFINAMFLRP